MRLGAVLGPSWGRLGAVLGPSWGPLGVLLGPLATFLMFSFKLTLVVAKSDLILLI